jgi:hypothetical protein
MKPVCTDLSMDADGAMAASQAVLAAPLPRRQ